jgi:hypothetical protein
MVSKLGLPITEVKLLTCGEAGWIGGIRMASLRGSMGERDFSGVAFFDPVGVALPSIVDSGIDHQSCRSRLEVVRTNRSAERRKIGVTLKKYLSSQ